MRSEENESHLRLNTLFGGDEMFEWFKALNFLRKAGAFPGSAICLFYLIDIEMGGGEEDLGELVQFLQPDQRADIKVFLKFIFVK